MKELALEVKNLSFDYDGITPILKDVSFSLSPGESLGVLGPNGGGKTTLLKIITGLLKPKSGEIYFFNHNVNNFSQYPFHFFSYVPQTSSLDPIMPVKVSEYLDYAVSLLSRNERQQKSDELIKKLCQLVGLENKANALMRELSGGEKQRALIARALVKNPAILFLDEPTKGLDSKGQDQLLELIANIKEKNKTAVMIVDHNINQIIRSCGKILCLNRTSHWHDERDYLTKDILEDIYHCEFEHLLIHEKDLEKRPDAKFKKTLHSEHHDHNHHECQHHKKKL